MTTPTPSELPIVQKTYDLIKWYVPILNRLPRDHKFGLGDRMVSTLYDLLEGFVTTETSCITSRSQIESYLATLRLKTHPIKSQLTQTRYGASFVGFRVLPDRIRVRNHNLQTGRRRLKRLQVAYASGELSEHEVAQSLQSWNAHLAHGDTWRLRQNIFNNLDLPHPLK